MALDFVRLYASFPRVSSLSPMSNLLYLLGLTAIGGLLGCGNDEPKYRQYMEMTGTAAPLHVQEAEDGTLSAQPLTPPTLPTPSPSPASPLEWTAPEGWTAEAASGMRKASFKVPGDAQCTIIGLGGNAGGDLANVKRWIGQLNVTPPEDTALQQFIDAAPVIVTGQKKPLRIIDLSSFVGTSPETPTTLAAIFPRGDQTIFVKMTGPRSAVSAATPAFTTLCESLR